MILASLLLAATSLPAGTAFRFEDFAVPVEAATSSAPLKLDTARARRMRTLLGRSAAEGPNFAGHFRIVEWGCGTCCVEFAIVDLQKRTVWFPSFFLACGYTPTNTIVGEADTYYRADSALLVVRGSKNGGTTAVTSNYRWDGAALRSLDTVPRSLRPSQGHPDVHGLVAATKAIDVRSMEPGLPSLTLERWLLRTLGANATLEWDIGDCDLKPRPPPQPDGNPLCVAVQGSVEPRGSSHRGIGLRLHILIGNPESGSVGAPTVFDTSFMGSTVVNADPACFEAITRLTDIPKRLQKLAAGDCHE